MPTKGFVAQAERPRWVIWNDWTGAAHKLEILAETIDGQYVLDGWAIGLGTILADKTKVKVIEKEG